MLLATGDLARATDLAEEYGVGNSTITFWSSKPGFPEPVYTKGRSRTWSRQAVREWVNGRNAALFVNRRFIVRTIRRRVPGGQSYPIGYLIYDRVAKINVGEEFKVKAAAIRAARNMEPVATPS